MNAILEQIPSDISGLIYTATLYGSIPLAMIFGVLYASKYQISRVKGAGYTLTIFVLVYAIMFGLAKVSVLLGKPGDLSGSKCAIFVLIPALLLSKLWKMPAMEGSDFVAPSLLIGRGFSKIGCIFAGCCHGYECDWGMYSNYRDGYYFPLQPIEMVACFVIALVVMGYAKRRNYHAGGRVYALALLLHGIERYLVQFLVEDHSGVLGFNEQSVYAILMILMGLIIFYFADNPIKLDKAKK